MPARSRPWADFNRNGSLEPEEIEDLVRAVIALVREPHDSKSPVDEFFDRNRNGHIDREEMERARHVFFELQLARLYEFAPEIANQIDLNRDRMIERGETEMVRDFLFYDPGLRRPHRVSNPLDERLDWNGNGFIDKEEIRRSTIELFRTVSLLPFELIEEEWMPREGKEVMSFLDELADLNRDGFVDPEELKLMEEGLGRPHRAATEFDHRIDFNGNGEVEAFEIKKARRAGEVREPGEEPGAPGEYPIRTVIDERLDLDRNGIVSEKEIRIILRFLVHGPERTEKLEKRSGLFALFDINSDGKVEREEFLEFREMYLRPHPVNPGFQLDRKLDKNGDGFVDPEEIGIAGGFSASRPVPSFEERLERLRWREEIKPGPTDEEQPEVIAAESTWQRKPGLDRDKKLAVVGLNTTTRNVDSEAAEGVKVFIENAFVNTGKVRVVDRQNVEKIVKEYEFQQSDLTDEKTAVEIGKLSGADIIVIGSLSYVGKKYYLNIKLIDVETAEIIGSSIAEAENDSEFYDMCNTAVYKLF